MTNKKLWVVLTTMVLGLVTLDSLASAISDDQYSRETLRGLLGIGVAVEDLSPDAKKHGLTEERIKTDVELRLRTAGIKVLTDEERLKTPGSPYLYVNVGTMNVGTRGNHGLYSIALMVDLVQEVSLERNPSIKTLASTWRSGGVGAVGELNLSQIRGAVKDKVDEFINAYLAVNPKK